MGGTYYIGERQLTIENAQAILHAIEADGQRVIRRAVEVSEAGRGVVVRVKGVCALYVVEMKGACAL